MGWTVQQRKQRQRGGMRIVLGISEIVLNVYTWVDLFHPIFCKVYITFKTHTSLVIVVNRITNNM